MPDRSRTPLAAKLASALAVLAIVGAGVWVTGAVVSDDMTVARAATTVFLGVAFVACLLVVRARRDLLLPVLGTFLVAATALGGWLAYESLVDDEVDEDVAVGAPASGGAAPRAGGGEQPAGEAERAPRGNVELARGTFSDLSHPTEGRASVVELADGGRVLTLTGFETDPGPDLRVYLATDEDASEFEDVGALKGNKGDQQYELPDDLDLDRYSTVLVWCRAFTVGFGKAELARS